ncbi:tRNA (N6-isopentenyl adenosine(37)-C2)-methylthiotransferase MiaB [bacterium]|nr:MAG: tRNA (N6-isopentenyl adenosine(37)-C2)-methylthiotransferase MiaB [bacterium]
MPSYVFLETFGCQMNDSDSKRLLSFLKNINYIRTDSPEKADLIILNTCTIREKAEHKVYSALGKFKPLKYGSQHIIIAVAGCVAQQAGEALLKKVPYLDLVIGTHNIHLIEQLLKRVSEKKERISATGFFSEMNEAEYTVASHAEGARALVSIMRGCDNFCSYCVVPFTRGREASRNPDDILFEITALAKKGVIEVTLVGQNVNSFGRGTPNSFAGLLKSVLGIDGIERVRFVTSHPKDISRELIALFAGEGKLCAHIHLPVQSGSDAVLKRMKRGYTRQEYLDKIGLLRDARPDIAITTDIITGFPGETDADFDDTMRLIEEVRFDNNFSFMYSPRPGTVAASLEAQLPLEVKSQRLDVVQQRQREITEEINLSLVGRHTQVLIEGPGKLQSFEYTGKTSCGRVLKIILPFDMTGKLVDVEIIEAYRNSLRGELSQRTSVCC